MTEGANQFIFRPIKNLEIMVEGDEDLGDPTKRVDEDGSVGLEGAGASPVVTPDVLEVLRALKVVDVPVLYGHQVHYITVANEDGGGISVVMKNGEGEVVMDFSYTSDGRIIRATFPSNPFWINTFLIGLVPQKLEDGEIHCLRRFLGRRGQFTFEGRKFLVTGEEWHGSIFVCTITSMDLSIGIHFRCNLITGQISGFQGNEHPEFLYRFISGAEIVLS